MVERTPSGAVKASARHAAERRGHTMRGGSFPIENARDLANAKHDVGRAKNPAAARRWINKRAKELGEPPLGGSKESGELRGIKVGDESSAETRTARRAMLYGHARSRAQMKD